MAKIRKCELLLKWHSHATKPLSYPQDAGKGQPERKRRFQRGGGPGGLVAGLMDATVVRSCAVANCLSISLNGERGGVYGGKRFRECQHTTGICIHWTSSSRRHSNTTQLLIVVMQVLIQNQGGYLQL